MRSGGNRMGRQAVSPKPEPHLSLGTTPEGYPFILTGEEFAQRHKHIMGTSGSGKSMACAGYIAEIFGQGEAFCLLDPHGDLAKTVLSLFAATGYFEDDPQAFNCLGNFNSNGTNNQPGPY